MTIPINLKWGLILSGLSQLVWSNTASIIAPVGCDQLKDSAFAKHDPKRPQPIKVKGQRPTSNIPPNDAVILFNGKNLDAFQNSRTSPNKSKITKDGILQLGPGGLSSQKQFSDCQVHLEWRVPNENKIKGQKGSNCGIALMGLFEIQILESFNNLTYADGHAGAMYGERPPLVNASLPQGEWQSFDIFFKAPTYKDKKITAPAKLTLIHNGVIVHLDQSFENLSSYRKHKPYPNYPLSEGPIQIKWDGDVIDFKNIWVRPINNYDAVTTLEIATAQVSDKKEDSKKTN